MIYQDTTVVEDSPKDIVTGKNERNLFVHVISILNKVASFTQSFKDQFKLF